ncbi:MAG: hypothetical protein NTY95_15715 [Bacteroidia bacterium]|nr:hypothetical protein [Bacteroidia bacterium]
MILVQDQKSTANFKGNKRGSRCRKNGENKLCPSHASSCDVFPYGKQGKCGQELMKDMIEGIEKPRVPATIEPKFVDLNIARKLKFSNEEIEEINLVGIPHLLR